MIVANIKWILAAFALLAGSAPALAAKKPPSDPPVLRLGSLSSPDSAVTALAQDFFAYLGQNVGVKFELVDGPLKRILVDAAKGRLDGLAYRTQAIQSLPALRSLLPVPTSLGKISASAYALDSSAPCLQGWQDLAKTGKRFSIVRGYIQMQRTVDSLGLQNYAVVVDSIPQAFRLLRANRITYILDYYSVIETLIQSRKQPPGLRYAGEISTQPLFLYLHENHRDLIAPIDSLIQAIHRDSSLSLIPAPTPPRFNPGHCRFQP